MNQMQLGHTADWHGRSATHHAMALMAEKRFDARLVYTHTFTMEDLPTALRHARERIDDAIKVVVSMRQGSGGGAKEHLHRIST